jgi:hypothetical protein
LTEGDLFEDVHAAGAVDVLLGLQPELTAGTIVLFL